MSAKADTYYSAECDECGWVYDADEGTILAGTEDQAREWWLDAGNAIAEDGRWLCSECAETAERNRVGDPR